MRVMARNEFFWLAVGLLGLELVEHWLLFLDDFLARIRKSCWL